MTNNRKELKPENNRKPPSSTVKPETSMVEPVLWNCWKGSTMELFFCSKNLLFSQICWWCGQIVAIKSFLLRLAMLERVKTTEYLCLALKLAFWSCIYRSSMRKREIRGTDDGIAKIDNRSNFLR